MPSSNVERSEVRSSSTHHTSSGASLDASFSAVSWSPMRYAFCICIFSSSCSFMSSALPTCRGDIIICC